MQDPEGGCSNLYHKVSFKHSWFIMLQVTDCLKDALLQK